MGIAARKGSFFWSSIRNLYHSALRARASLPAGLILSVFVIGPLWFTISYAALHTADSFVTPRGFQGGLPTKLRGMINTTFMGTALMGAGKAGGKGKNGTWPDFELFECDRSSNITEYCVIQGDVRVDYKTGEIVLVARQPETPRGRLVVQPYPRKWHNSAMKTVTVQEVYSVDGSGDSMEEDNIDLDALRVSEEGGANEKKRAPRFRRKDNVLECTKRSNVPAVLFSAGGFSGGIFHDFNEVFIPLFQTTQMLHREVVLIVSDLKGYWWFRGNPSESFVGSFTNYPIRLMNNETDAEGTLQEVECFPKLIIGLKHNLCLYDYFGGKEARDEVKAGVRLRDFSLRVMESMKLPQSMWDPENNQVSLPEGKQPHLCIVQRQTTRRIINYDRLRELALDEGFGVSDIEFEALTPHQSVVSMRSCDGLIGVHGAGLSNAVFMRPRSVILQIIPFGEGMFKIGREFKVGREFKILAEALAASYMEWHVPREYSSLWTQFNATSVELSDPSSLWNVSYIKAMKFYHNQDISVPEDVFKDLLRHINHTLALQEGITGVRLSQVEVNRTVAAC